MDEDHMIMMDLANAGLVNLNDNTRIRIITEVPNAQHSEQNETPIQVVPDQRNAVTDPIENHLEQDQIVPEIQDPEPAQNSQSRENRKKPKKRRTKKKNFGNKPKKRNQRNYRKFPAIRVQQQPQEDENFPYIPLDDMDPVEPVENDPLPLKGTKM